MLISHTVWIPDEDDRLDCTQVFRRPNIWHQIGAKAPKEGLFSLCFKEAQQRHEGNQCYVNLWIGIIKSQTLNIGHSDFAFMPQLRSILLVSNKGKRGCCVAMDYVPARNDKRHLYMFVNFVKENEASPDAV